MKHANLNQLSDAAVKNHGLDPHALKRGYEPVSRYNLYMEKGTGLLYIWNGDNRMTPESTGVKIKR